MLLTDIIELRKILEIEEGDVSESLKLNFFIEQASSWIEEYLNRGDLGKKARTEYYSGTTTQNLMLRSRPVYLDPLPVVYVDINGFWGQASNSFTNPALTYGTDFCLNMEESPDGASSRSGILVRMNAVWERPWVRAATMQYTTLTPYIGQGTGNVKVTYTAGWTTDTVPAMLRHACDTLVARMRHMFPMGLEFTSENYEDRSQSWAGTQKDYLMALVKPILFGFRNRKW